MSDTHEPVPPLTTIADDDRQPPRRPTSPRPAPIAAHDDIPPAAKAAGAVFMVLAAIALLSTLVPKAMEWARHADWSWAIQWAATITDPVHSYLQAHTVGLPITAASVYLIWQGIGAGSLALAWLIRSNGARLTWTAHGAATIWMVWASSPTTGRTVAAALAILAWTAGSVLALRGLSLRVRVTR
ncbi:hypothetical protein OG365_40660 (plasmid) [Streptomyces sp. NBC_00853]|uniref:hypothetical protein n=1 Tax=Streptomyces sp. NBC_00853 TaxID=2903681 RepID=UPI002F90D432|nr:hypothetical protein OG365_40660 [Streptomyces sp. NBC_00853]